MKKTCGTGVFALATIALALTASARAFDNPEKICQKQAAAAMGVDRGDVKIRRGDTLNDGSGSLILIWDARLRGGSHHRGYCQVDPRGKRIVRFETNEYMSERAFVSPGNGEQVCRQEAARRIGVDIRDVATSPLQSGDTGNYRFKWYTDLAGRNNSAGSCEVDRYGTLVRLDQDNAAPGLGFMQAGDYPREKFDTPGDGRFNGGRFRDIRLQSVYLDTRTRPELVLRGVHGFRIAFYGDVEGYQANGGWMVRMSVNRSDHGDVRGRAEIHLNRERSQIESVDFHGVIDGSPLNSNFMGVR